MTGPYFNSPAQVIRMLNTLGNSVAGLMTLHQSAPILKEKLNQVEALIAELPDSKETTAMFWRRKLANWWRDYALMLADNEKLYGVHASDGTFSVSVSPIVKSQLRPPSPNSIYQVKACKVMADIFDQLEKHFDHIPMLHSPADVDGMKRLISAIVRGFELVSYMVENPLLHEHFFGLAYDKFPESVRDLFYAQYSSFTVFSLFKFLRLEIEDQSNLCNICPDHQAEYDEGGDCIYCHQDGHFVTDCPQLFCFGCYQIGHIKSYCQHGPILVNHHRYYH